MSSKTVAGPAIKGFLLLEVIGGGGMSTIYKGLQEALNRPVAIKELSKSYAQDKNLIERFVRESQVAAALSHENILHIYDYCNRGDSHCIIMEYVEGVDLAFLLERLTTIPITVGLIIAYEIARALNYAHSFGIVHRDIKPANILISRKGGVKLTDFGIAQIPQLNSLTLPGTFLGTPAYMSPEQAQGDRIGPASDQFSLGVVLYEILTGVKPFFEDDEKTIFERIRKAEFLPPRKIDPKIPRQIARLIGKCLSANPSKRFSSTLEMARQFQKILRKRWNGDPRKFLRDFLIEADVFKPLETDEWQDEKRSGEHRNKFASKKNTYLVSLSGQPLATRQDWSIVPPVAPAMYFYRWVRNLCLVLVPTFIIWAVHHPTFPRRGLQYELKRLQFPPQEPTTSSVRVNARPWAMIYLDQSIIGLTPTAETFEIATGEHVLRFSNPQHGEKEWRFEMRPGEHREFFFDFENPGDGTVQALAPEALANPQPAKKLPSPPEPRAAAVVNPPIPAEVPSPKRISKGRRSHTKSSPNATSSSAKTDHKK